MIVLVMADTLQPIYHAECMLGSITFHVTQGGKELMENNAALQFFLWSLTFARDILSFGLMYFAYRKFLEFYRRFK